MKATESSEYFYSHIVTVKGEKHLREVCTLTGQTCLREDHDCGNCERGDIARKWKAKYGAKIVPDLTKSTQYGLDHMP